MDQRTIDFYNDNANEMSELYSRSNPITPRQFTLRHFHKDQKTLDIGCGQGRDVAWLSEQGYPCSGIDASESMLEQARKYNPGYLYINDYLPNLNNCFNNSFTFDNLIEHNSIHNIFCCGVLSHIPKKDLIYSIITFSELLISNGIIVLSFRGTHNSSNREGDRLYELIDEYSLVDLFKHLEMKLLEKESYLDFDRNLLWYNFVFQKK